MQTLFYIFLSIGFLSFLINFILKIKVKQDVFDLVVNSLFNKLSILSFVIAIVIYSVFSLSPYIQEQKDLYLIDSYNKNIVLYQTYIQDYQAAAQKQIEEYQAAQSAMARTATAIQLQYFSQQIDAVGKGITEQIKEFNKLVMEQKIAINLAQSRLNIRKLNKFYFY